MLLIEIGAFCRKHRAQLSCCSKLASTVLLLQIGPYCYEAKACEKRRAKLSSTAFPLLEIGPKSHYTTVVLL